MQPTPYTQPAPIDTDDKLIHTCARHPFVGQCCNSACRTYCGLELAGHHDELVGSDSPACCVVCESMYAAEYRR